MSKAAMIIGQQSLQLLQSAGQFVPVPAIGVAAGVALAILDIVQTITTNKEGFITIGKDSCTIMVTVIRRVNLSSTGKAPSIDLQTLEEDARTLLDEMERIKKAVKKYKKRGLAKRIFYSATDAETLQECRDRLQSALALFGLQSDIEVRKQLAFLSDQVAEILENQKHPQMPRPEALSPLSHPPMLPQTPSSFPPSFPSSIPPYPPSPALSSREDRKAARLARKEERGAQQAMNLAGFPGPQTDSTFSNIQNHLSPGGNINYSYANGDMVNNNRDDSFNVGGSGNSINISFTR